LGSGRRIAWGICGCSGKTGAGKSTLLTNLIYKDMQAERGLMVLDPRGDLVESLFDRLLPISLRDI